MCVLACMCTHACVRARVCACVHACCVRARVHVCARVCSCSPQWQCGCLRTTLRSRFSSSTVGSTCQACMASTFPPLSQLTSPSLLALSWRGAAGRGRVSEGPAPLCRWVGQVPPPSFCCKSGSLISTRYLSTGSENTGFEIVLCCFV